MAKNMDKLSQDAAAALAAGMTYGKYMAMKKPIIVEKVPVQPTGYKHTCLNCGKEFYVPYRYLTKYCGRRCREAFHYAMKKKEKEV